MDTKYADDKYVGATVASALKRCQFVFTYAIDGIPPVSKTSGNKLTYEHKNTPRNWTMPVCLGDASRTAWSFQIVARSQHGDNRRIIEEPFWEGDLDRIDKACDSLVQMACTPECVILGPMAYGYWENKCTAPTADALTSSPMEPSESLPVE